MKDLDLNIQEKQLILSATNKYYLDIALPYKVNSDEGSAKFESKIKTLTVTLPTVIDEEAENHENDNRIEVVNPEESSETAKGNNEEHDEDDAPSALKFVTEASNKNYQEGNLRVSEDFE